MYLVCVCSLSDYSLHLSLHFPQFQLQLFAQSLTGFTVSLHGVIKVFFDRPSAQSAHFYTANPLM